jgi:hypothetical protein
VKIVAVKFWEAAPGEWSYVLQAPGGVGRFDRSLRDVFAAQGFPSFELAAVDAVRRQHEAEQHGRVLASVRESLTRP